MSKFRFFIIPFLGILALTCVIYLLPQPGPKGGGGVANDAGQLTLIKDRYRSITQIVAASDNLIDAVIMEDNFTLNRVLAQIKRIESDVLYASVVGKDNTILGSLDTLLAGKAYKAPAGLKTLGDEPFLIQESASGNIKQLHFAVPVVSSGKKIAALYLQAKAAPPLATTRSAPVNAPKSPLILGLGVVFAFMVSFVVVAVAGSMKGAVLDKLVNEQQHLFSPKIAQLKKEEEQLKTDVDNLIKRKSDLDTEAAAAQITVVNAKKEYEVVMQQIAQHPITQSVEKLKTAEADLIKRLEQMKAEGGKAAKELELAKAQHETIRKSLESERQEEKALHDRLDLIKKKILRLEG